MIETKDDMNMTQLVDGVSIAVMKSLLAVSKLPGVYCEETQMMNCYLYMIANYANVTYNHKYYVVNAWAIISVFLFHSNLSSSLKSEFVTQFWGKSFPSNLSDELRFEGRTQIWVKSKTTYYCPSIHNVHHSNLSETVWYPPDLSEPSNLSNHPELRESRSDHPELSASPIFEGGHLPAKDGVAVSFHEITIKIVACQMMWAITYSSDYEYISKSHWYSNDIKEFTKPYISTISWFKRCAMNITY